MSEAPNTEGPSIKKRVTQAGGLMFLLLVTLFGFFAMLGPKHTISAPITDQTPTASKPGAAPGELSDSARELAALQPELAALGIHTKDGKPAAPNEDEMTAKVLLEALQRSQADHNAGANGLGADGHAGQAPAPQIDTEASRAMDARRSPLRSVAQAEGYATGKAGAGKAGPALPLVPAGTVLDARLSQTLSSDYPGTPWIATLSRSVYGVDGRLAAPAGSRLLGTTAAADGPNSILQGRLSLRLERLILPSGQEIALASQVLDGAGIGAVPGDTNRHVLAQTFGVLAYAVIGASTGAAASGDPISTQSQLQSATVAGAGQQVQPLANKYLSVTPTVTVKAGAALHVVLTSALGSTPTQPTAG